MWGEGDGRNWAVGGAQRLDQPGASRGGRQEGSEAVPSCPFLCNLRSKGQAELLSLRCNISVELFSKLSFSQSSSVQWLGRV